MHHRRSALAAAGLTLLLCLSLAGCSGDDDSDSATTTAAPATTAADGSATIADTVADQTSTTLTQAQFDAAIAAFDAELDAAGNDFCKVTQAMASLTVSNPTTPEQTKVAIEAFAKVLTKVADTTPAGSDVDAAALKSAGAAVVAEAEASSYDPSVITGGGTPAALEDPAFIEAIQGVTKAMGEACPQQ